MDIIKNSCGKRRGCEINTALPHDSRIIIVHSKMYGLRNDLQKVLPTVDLLVDKMEKKEKQMEKKVA